MRHVRDFVGDASLQRVRGSAASALKSRPSVRKAVCVTDTNSMRAHVRRSATRGGEVRLTSAQLDALTDEGVHVSPTLKTFPGDDCVGVVDGRRIILDDSASLLRIDIVKREGREPMAVVIGDLAVLGTGLGSLEAVGAKINQLITKGRMEAE